MTITFHYLLQPQHFRNTNVTLGLRMQNNYVHLCANDFIAFPIMFKQVIDYFKHLDTTHIHSQHKHNKENPKNVKDSWTRKR